MVEPNERLCDELERIRSDDKLLRCGIGIGNDGTTDYYDFGVAGQGHNTFKTESAEHSMSLFSLQGVTKKELVFVNNIIESCFSSTAPDFISIDTEGFNEEILTSLDLKNTGR